MRASVFFRRSSPQDNPQVASDAELSVEAALHGFSHGFVGLRLMQGQLPTRAMGMQQLRFKVFRYPFTQQGLKRSIKSSELLRTCRFDESPPDAVL